MTKIDEIEKKITNHDHNKYTTTEEFDKLTAGNFADRFAQAKLTIKTDDVDFLKRQILMKNKKINKKPLQIKQNMQRMKKN